MPWHTAAMDRLHYDLHRDLQFLCVYVCVYINRQSGLRGLLAVETSSHITTNDKHMGANTDTQTHLPVKYVCEKKQIEIH